MTPKPVLNYLTKGRLKTVPLHHTTAVSFTSRKSLFYERSTVCTILGDLKETLVFPSTLMFSQTVVKVW